MSNCYPPHYFHPGNKLLNTPPVKHNGDCGNKTRFRLADNYVFCTSASTFVLGRICVCRYRCGVSSPQQRHVYCDRGDDNDAARWRQHALPSHRESDTGDRAIRPFRLDVLQHLRQVFDVVRRVRTGSLSKRVTTRLFVDFRNSSPKSGATRKRILTPPPHKICF